MGLDSTGSLWNTLIVCLSLPGVLDGHFWDYPIGTIAAGKQNQAQLNSKIYFELGFKYYLNPGFIQHVQC